MIHLRGRVFENFKVPTQARVEIGLMLQIVTVNFVLFRLLCFLIFVVWRKTVLQLIKILAIPCGRRYPQHRRLSLWLSISGKLVPFNWKTRCKDKSHIPLPSTQTDSFGKARGISACNPCRFISDGSVVTATSWKHNSLHSKITSINFTVSHSYQDSQGFGDQTISARLFLVRWILFLWSLFVELINFLSQTGSHSAHHTVRLSLRMSSSSFVPSVAQNFLEAQIWCSQYVWCPCCIPHILVFYLELAAVRIMSLPPAFYGKANRRNSSQLWHIPALYPVAPRCPCQ